jgi:hypothetical protein
MSYLRSECRYAEYGGLQGSSYPGVPVPAGFTGSAIAPEATGAAEGSTSGKASLVDVQALAQSVREGRERLQMEIGRRAKAQVRSSASLS